jgi:hypothetical protein
VYRPDERAPGEWIDNPLLPVLEQWKALRDEAIAELRGQ